MFEEQIKQLRTVLNSKQKHENKFYIYEWMYKEFLHQCPEYKNKDFINIFDIRGAYSFCKDNVILLDKNMTASEYDRSKKK